MKVFISGVISKGGTLSAKEVKRNCKAFMREAERLRALGHEVVNPAELVSEEASWQEAMRVDIKALVDCEAISLLAGWTDSPGARIERELALALGFRMIYPGEPVE